VKSIGAGPVRDLGLLDSACHRPQASFFGQEAYPALAGKAAALMHSLACHHALVDSNKRLALLATVVFLRIHGYVPDLTDDEAFDLTMSVAAGQLVPVRQRSSCSPTQFGAARSGALHSLPSSIIQVV
jgi:death-on-curing protein